MGLKIASDQVMSDCESRGGRDLTDHSMFEVDLDIAIKLPQTNTASPHRFSMKKPSNIYMISFNRKYIEYE